jgi:hypothetical protein
MFLQPSQACPRCKVPLLSLNYSDKMGVNGIWKVLQDRGCSARVDLRSLREKTLAVDLSVWIAQGQVSRTLAK